MEAADLRYFAFLGFVGMAISMSLYQLSILYANASVVAVLFSSNPLFVLVLAYLILKEPIHIRNIVALILDIIGIIFIIDPWNMHVEVLGVVLTLSATLLFALYTVLVLVFVNALLKMNLAAIFLCFRAPLWLNFTCQPHFPS